MPVNDGNVRVLIAGALANAGNGDACCGHVDVGFRDLQARRQVPGASLDMDLAAAEHYLFARFMVCRGVVGPTQMRALIVGYDIKKWIDRARGKPNATATTIESGITAGWCGCALGPERCHRRHRRSCRNATPWSKRRSGGRLNRCSGRAAALGLTRL